MITLILQSVKEWVEELFVEHQNECEARIKALEKRVLDLETNPPQ